MEIREGERVSLKSVLLTVTAFTWLNPHVYLDTVVLIGSISAQYDDRITFALGAMNSSFVFFFSLGNGDGKPSQGCARVRGGAGGVGVVRWLGGEVGEEGVEREGEAGRGADWAVGAWGRGHVVGEVNRMNGMGSTPSFAVLRSLDDWLERFLAFYALNPHPSFTIIPDVTEPFDETRPSPISPVTLTLEELENIVAYTATMDPADLGSPIAHQ